MRKTHWVWATGVLALGMMAAPAFAQKAQRDLPGPIDSLEDLQDTGRMLFKIADENNDNQISQKEAVDAGNLIVGGFFFRADANGDGSLTPEEVRSARDGFLNEKPWLKYMIETVRSEKEGDKNNSSNSGAGNLTSSLFTTFDSNNDKKLEASEVRDGIKSITQGLFATADTNRDGQLTPTEVNAAITGAGKTLADAAFRKADKDNDGTLTEKEFDEALRQPLHAAFIVADLNHDGKISKEEMTKWRQVAVSKLRAMRVPEPENSPKHLLESGRKPSEVAPVPTFTKPNTNNRNNQPESATQPR